MMTFTRGTAMLLDSPQNRSPVAAQFRGLDAEAKYIKENLLKQ